MRLLIPLFSPATGTWGGLTRVIAVAEAARWARHAVAFCASGYLATELRQRGYPVYATPPTTMLGLPGPLSRFMEKRSQQTTLPIKPGRDFGNIWFVLVLSGLARTGYLRRLAQAEMQAAREFGADALFTDLDLGAYLTATITGLPIASAYADVLRVGIGSFAWHWVRRAIAPVLRDYRKPVVTPDELCFGPSVLKIIPSIPELDGTDPARPDVHYVGHLLGDIRPVAREEFQPEPERRYIFVYVGTGSISLDQLRRVLPSVFPSGHTHRCLVGAQSITRVEHLGGVEFRPYVPAGALLPYCDWTLCHGGQNTIIQSLLYGVPLLVFPGPIFERRFNARKVQEAGAGCMGELNEFTAEWLRHAMTQQAACAPQARGLGERIRSFGGATAAVHAIEKHVRVSRSPA